MRGFTSIVLLAGMVGCIPIPISESAEGTLEGSLDMRGPCEGTGEEGPATFTKSIETVEGVETCRVDIDWSGDLVDFSGVRDNIESRLGVDLSAIQVEVTSLDITIADLRVLDADGNPISAPTATFGTDLDIADVDAFTIDGASLDALLSEPVAVDVTDELIASVQTALNEGSSIGGTAASVLRIPTADLGTLQDASNPLQIEVDVQADVAGEVSQNFL